LRSLVRPAILSFMAQCSRSLDDLFAALADPTRRAMVSTLGRAPASVGELARSASMTLPSFMKHVHTLERCGLIHTSKSGRVRTCTLDRKRLGLVDGWLSDQRAAWEGRTDRLERFVTNVQEPS
jgi:DNA-binding transcriptional ArsR family regulator